MTTTTENHTINPAGLRERIERGDRLQLVDVRSVREFDEGHIPGAINIPLEQVEARLNDLDHRDPAVLVCQSGRRAKICQELLTQHRGDLIVLQGGTKAWADAGYRVIRTTANRLPLMRQVQLVAGPLVLIGSLLARFIDPNWAFLSAFVGAGLTVAGATGFCGMANLLALMPWNKSK